jgi:hypothetical protein
MRDYAIEGEQTIALDTFSYVAYPEQFQNEVRSKLRDCSITRVFEASSTLEDTASMTCGFFDA